MNMCYIASCFSWDAFGFKSQQQIQTTFQNKETHELRQLVLKEQEMDRQCFSPGRVIIIPGSYRFMFLHPQSLVPFSGRWKNVFAFPSILSRHDNTLRRRDSISLFFQARKRFPEVSHVRTGQNLVTFPFPNQLLTIGM